MSKLRLGLMATVTLATIASADSRAQGPVSNRCITPQFWCVLPTYAPIGVSCYCNTPYGPVWGRVG